MNESDNTRSLIPLPDASLANIATGAKRLLSEMVGETLALTRQEQTSIQSARRRIGDYEFCETDYRQILLWAEAMALEPEEVILRLLDTRSLTDEYSGDTWEPTAFQDGRIVKLNWDLELLPLSDFEWVDGLEIEYLRFTWQARESDEEPSIEVFSPRLPKLLRLNCRYAFCELNLAGIPRLEELNCSWNHLALLNLNDTPNLRKLDCDSCKLTELDLSGVPHLEQLKCRDNSLFILDLNPVPKLARLNCEKNNISALDLLCVPQLTKLDCGDNELTELNLLDVPQLVELRCAKNQVMELDLKVVPHLTVLKCGSNPLTELILAGLPKLQLLSCENNNLTALDLSGVSDLRSLGGC